MVLNEFPSIFQKVQHSYSRHQKTTSNLRRVNLKGILKFNEIWPLEGAMVGFSGASRKFNFFAIFSENLWFQTIRFTRLLEVIQLYEQKRLEKFLIFTIYQNYTLALNIHPSAQAWWDISDSFSVKLFYLDPSFFHVQRWGYVGWSIIPVNAGINHSIQTSSDLPHILPEPCTLEDLESLRWPCH